MKRDEDLWQVLLLLVQSVYQKILIGGLLRGLLIRRATQLKKQGILNFSVTQVSAATIDTIGITQAVQQGINSCLKKLNQKPNTTTVLLDGLLKAPPEYTHQETIIKGDAKEKVIGLASICAKVTRDRTLVRVAREYPNYHFDVHKGYGTKAHIKAITTYGLCPLHRRSFTRRFRS